MNDKSVQKIRIPTRCEECQGSGWKLITTGGIEAQTGLCSRCHGTGQVGFIEVEKPDPK